MNNIQHRVGMRRPVLPVRRHARINRNNVVTATVVSVHLPEVAASVRWVPLPMEVVDVQVVVAVVDSATGVDVDDVDWLI